MFLKRLSQLNIITIALFMSSCSSVDNTWNAITDSVTNAGDYLYDSVSFWEDDDEPEQSDAVIIEEAVEVPDFALPDQEYLDQNQNVIGMQPPSQSFQQAPTSPYYNPIYRSQRQYYYVGPNGTPLPAPPPPPFPQYSIDQRSPVPYSYTNNFGYPSNNSIPNMPNTTRFIDQVPEISAPIPMNKEDEMELFGIQNNCIKVKEDYVNGGYMCDDFD